MNQKLRLLLMTLLCAVVGSLWAEETTIGNASFSKNGCNPNTWTTTGTGLKDAFIIIGSGENITSPAFDFSSYSKVTITIKARRYGTLSNSKATIDASIDGTSVGTTTATGTNANTELTAIEFTPTSSMKAAQLVFTCTNATSAGSTHGAGISTITITGTLDGDNVEAPTFNPAGGEYTDAQTVTISAQEGATIYYTTNGEDPTTSSTVYNGAISISETTTLKAIASNGTSNSAVASATYTITTEPTLANAMFNGKDAIYPEGWTTTGTGKERTDCIIIGSGENITSPAFDFSSYSKVTITIKARRYGTLSDSKATIDASISGTSVGTTTATGTNANTELPAIEFTPTSSMTAAQLVFTCTNATSAGSTHGAGINTIIIKGTLKPADFVDPPVFSVAEGEYNETQTVTISAQEGATIYYTTNGEDPTTNSTVYDGAISISETTTLKAIASNGTNNSAVTSATYTIVTPITIAAARTQQTGEVFTQGIVTSISGTTAFIQDNTAAICVYGDNSLVVGNEIKVKGTLTSYKGLLEITNPTCTVVSTGNTVTPEVKTIAEISNDIQGQLISIENATIKTISGQNITIEQDGNTIEVRSVSGLTANNVNDFISLTGNVGCYDKPQIVNPTDVKVTANVEPTIVVSNTTVKLTFAANTGTIEVTYSNVDPEKTEITFFEQDGTTTATYDWITAEINQDGNIAYTISANESDERTAYLKVHDTENDIYSELITFSQAAPSIASLPFVFNGGKADIENTKGLSQNGLGSDYTSSGSPKLKFDSTGDYVLLQFNGPASKLTFDIKNNSFSGGTFTIQTSEDGNTFTDLKAYTTITGTQNESFDNIGENVRFIRWIYTQRSSGNVGLGNIVLLGPAFTLSIPEIATDGTRWYATVSALGDGNFIVPEGLELSWITISDKGKMEKTQSATAGSVISGDGAYFVEATDKGDYKFVCTTDEALTPGVTWLYPAIAGQKVTAPLSSSDNDKYTFYKLSLNGASKPGSIGFYWGAKDGVPFTFNSANKAYLAVPKTNPSSNNSSINIDSTTGISTIAETGVANDATYSLSGVRMNSDRLPKGIYIVNGKKMIVK